MFIIMVQHFNSYRVTRIGTYKINKKKKLKKTHPKVIIKCLWINRNNYGLRDWLQVSEVLKTTLVYVITVYFREVILLKPITELEYGTGAIQWLKTNKSTVPDCPTLQYWIKGSYNRMVSGISDPELLFGQRFQNSFLYGRVPLGPNI